MEIQLIEGDREPFVPLLLLADEQESCLRQYLNRGLLLALYDPDLRAVCLVTQEDEGLFEIQNLAVAAGHRRKGYGKILVECIAQALKGKAHTLMVGTGDSPLTLPFYESCGFVFSHRIKDYMLTAYDRPIFENGIQLFDKVYLKMDL